jgi:hypothetical protein
MGQYMNYELLVEDTKQLYNDAVNQYNVSLGTYYTLVTILCFLIVIFLLIALLM